MARVWTGLLGLVLWGCVGASAAQAQQVPPPGSYRQTCNRVLFNNNVITAFCLNRRGEPQATMLNLAVCAPRADIANDNGRLVCPPPRVGPPPAPSAPPGSYRRSCRGETVAPGGMLRAECRTINGAWVWSGLNLSSCRPGDDISNQNGRLTCGGGNVPPPPPPPPGSYLRTCRNVSVAPGGMLRAECRTVNGAWVPSRLNLGTCGRGVDISNQNGQLICR